MDGQEIFGKFNICRSDGRAFRGSQCSAVYRMYFKRNNRIYWQFRSVRVNADENTSSLCNERQCFREIS